MTNASRSSARGPKLPIVFQYIIANDDRRLELRDRAVSGEMTMRDWRELKELVKDRQNLRRGAEIALSWNKDKGATT